MGALRVRTVKYQENCTYH